jgi:hypothetical protein
MAVYLEFSAEIRCVEYPAVAIFKLNRGASFCWNGDPTNDGHIRLLTALCMLEGMGAYCGNT